MNRDNQIVLPQITPIAPQRIPTAFDDADFYFELKHDGFRAIAYIEDGVCRLISRKNIVYKSFGPLSQAMKELKVENAILDGELVCLGNDGRSEFMTLMRRRSRDVFFYAFDCLWLDGVDLRPLELTHRKRVLRHVLKTSKVPSVMYAEHVEGMGTGLFNAVCKNDCEGIVAKHKRAPYSSTPQSWFKVINSEYSQHRGRREMFDRFRKHTDLTSVTAP